MQPATRFFFVLLILFAGSTRPVLAQQPVPVVDASSLGDQIRLNDGWLFHAGDNPEWSSPTLDDSAWTRVDLHADLAAYGVPADTRFGWLRLHVRLTSNGPPPVFGTLQTFGRYQVFANGQLIGSVGDMNEHTLYDRDFMTQFPIPPRVLTKGAPDGSDLVLALRCSFQKPTYGMSRPTALFRPGFAFLGTSRVLASTGTSFRVLNVVPLGANLLPSLVVAFFAIALFVAVRKRREYLLLGIVCLLNAVNSINEYRTWTTPYNLSETIVTAFTWFAGYIALLAFIRELLGGRHLRVLAAVGVVGAAEATMLPLWAAGLSPRLTSSLDALTYFAFNAAVFLLLVHAFRKANATLRRDLLLVMLGMGVETLGWTVDNLRIAPRYGVPVPQFLSQLKLISLGPFSLPYSDAAISSLRSACWCSSWIAACGLLASATAVWPSWKRPRRCRDFFSPDPPCRRPDLRGSRLPAGKRGRRRLLPVVPSGAGRFAAGGGRRCVRQGDSQPR